MGEWKLGSIPQPGDFPHAEEVSIDWKPANWSSHSRREGFLKPQVIDELGADERILLDRGFALIKWGETGD
ncbi:MAG: hypothetical protein QI199_00530, partial [Candidatus Korarchaeota archaeon]|nr:hypothetical protein [Candidatus Korarchaeota archaeon]